VAHNPWSLEQWSAAAEQLRASDLPFISLGVLNFNRVDALRQTLDVLLHAVQYPGYEIIVIDNGSTDGSVEMVQAEFPSILLQALPTNEGVSSRNIQPQIAKGKYLFSFDNDSIPATPATILRAVEHMEAHPSLDVLSMMCYQPYSGIEETAAWERFRLGGLTNTDVEGLYLVEGGACFRTAALLKLPGYDPKFVYGSEGMDLALQFFERGSKIALNKSVAVLHFHASRDGVQKSRYFANARNVLWMLLKHWPAPCLAFLLPAWIARRILGSLLHPSRASYEMRGLWSGIVGARGFVRQASKLNMRQAFALKRFYLFLFRW
jgi:GT2 family glycosyltransferase